MAGRQVIRLSPPLHPLAKQCPGHHCRDQAVIVLGEETLANLRCGATNAATKVMQRRRANGCRPCSRAMIWSWYAKRPRASSKPGKTM
mmetsp:Transcript_39518/g.91359  ORF Transcript_39518/g.91359 Transcript_39518/m.91359 type:complete len:88 (+) Transcript_39518:336-599(+)